VAPHAPSTRLGHRARPDEAAHPAEPGYRTQPTRTRPARLGRAVVAAGPVAYFTWLLLQQVRGDWPVLTQPGLDWETALSVSAVAYLGLLLLTYWHKPPPLAQRRDWRAILTTALAVDALGLSTSQPVTQPDAGALAAAFMVAGTLLAFWSAWYLGTGFSLLPQARRLVTDGPYRYVRHPVYLGGLLITLGEVWLRFSPLVVLLNLVFVAAQIVRLRQEEQILEHVFPEYRAYREQTSALIPGIY
jgi:protein-S-isoprenylcysteine O-methyltransferase Ste14